METANVNYEIYKCLLLHFTGAQPFALYEFFDKMEQPWLKDLVAIDGTPVCQEPDAPWIDKMNDLTMEILDEVNAVRTNTISKDLFK